MLYRTHKRYGLLFGLLLIPSAVGIGLIPTALNGAGIFLIILSVFTSIKASSFGAEFCDCDSYGGIIKDKKGKPLLDENGKQKIKKGSIPSQKYPLISKIFRFFHVKHRGKFSHDFVSQTVFWGISYLLIYGLGKIIMVELGKGNKFVVALVNLSMLYLIWLFSKTLIELKDDITMVANGKYKKSLHAESWEISKQVKLTIVVFVALVLLAVVTQTISFNLLNLTSGLISGSIVVTCSKLFILFTLGGVYSHLIADMMTNEGVHIAGYRLAPAKIVLKLKKFPYNLICIGIGVALGYFFVPITYGFVVGGIVGVMFQWLLVKTDLKTGSTYEDLCRFVVTVACVPALVFALASLFNLI